MSLGIFRCVLRVDWFLGFFGFEFFLVRGRSGLDFSVLVEWGVG